MRRAIDALMAPSASDCSASAARAYTACEPPAVSGLIPTAQPMAPLDGHRNITTQQSSSGHPMLCAPQQAGANLAGCAYRVPLPTSAALSALALTRAQSTDSVALNRPALQRAGHSPGCYKACRSKAGRSNAGRFYAGATRSSRAADSDECGRRRRRSSRLEVGQRRPWSSRRRRARRR